MLGFRLSVNFSLGRLVLNSLESKAETESKLTMGRKTESFQTPLLVALSLLWRRLPLSKRSFA